MKLRQGSPKEKPVPETLDSAGTLTATRPTVDVSGRSSKSTESPLELPEEPAGLPLLEPPPPPPWEDPPGADPPPLGADPPPLGADPPLS